MKNICSLPLILLGVCLSALAGAQPGAKLHVSADIDCRWKLDGQPMDPLGANGKRDVAVSPGQHEIEASTIDGVATLRTAFNTTVPTQYDVEKGRFWVAIELKMQHDRRLAMQRVEATKVASKVETAPNLTWTDAGTGLTWTRKDNGSDLDWNEASSYCSDLQLGGYKDWRLPTVEELRGIYDPSVRIPTVFDAGPTNVHVKGNLKLTGWEWSSAQGPAPGKPWQTAREVTLADNQPGEFPLQMSYSMRALCVHRSGEGASEHAVLELRGHD